LERAGEDTAAADSARAKLPEGIVDREGAAAVFGVHTVTLDNWQTQGRLGRGMWTDVSAVREERRVGR
jgi:hypothetical protein